MLNTVLLDSEPPEVKMMDRGSLALDEGGHLSPGLLDPAAGSPSRLVHARRVGEDLEVLDHARLDFVA